MPSNNDVQDARHAALADIRVASGLLAQPERLRLRGIDLRQLSGGARYLHDLAHPTMQDAYAAAVDAYLERIPRLRNRGYVIERGAV